MDSLDMHFQVEYERNFHMRKFNFQTLKFAGGNLQVKFQTLKFAGKIFRLETDICIVAQNVSRFLYSAQ
jgi:hypothetical protein